MIFKVFQSALKCLISSFFHGLVLFLDLACQKQTVSASGEVQSSTAKECKVPLECPTCTLWAEADRTNNCVLFIPCLVARCCTLTTMCFFPSVPFPFVMAIPLVCFTAEVKKNLFFPHLLLPHCHWISEVHMYIGRLGNLLMYCETMLIIFCQALPACLSYHLAHLNFIVRFIQACPNSCPLGKAHPSALPLSHASCHLVQWGSMMLNLLSLRCCKASPHIKW